MKKLLFLSLLLAPVMALASLWDYYGTNLPTIADRGILAQKYGIVEQAKDYRGTADQNIALEKALTIKMADLYQNQYLGASVLPIAGTTYNLAGSGVSSSATSITLQSLTIPQTGQKIQDSDLSDTFYITLEPGNRTRQEISSCTTVTQNGGGTATLSGCSRGLSPITPYTASSTLAFVHAGGSQVIFSDPPQLFNQFAAKDNEATITKVWTYSIYPESGVGANATTTNQLITLGQANSIGNQGAATSTDAISGISEEATQLEMASSTPFDVNNPHYISSEYASSTPTVRGLGYVPVTENDGYLNQGWLDLTEDWNFTTTTAATSTITYLEIGANGGISAGTNLLVFGDGSDGDVTISTATTTLSRDMYYNNLTIGSAGGLNPNGYRIFVKGTLSIASGGLIARNGSNGGNGNTGVTGGTDVGGVAGASLSHGTLFGSYSGAVGGVGENSNGGDATNGGNGSAIYYSPVTNATACSGGAGGNGAVGGTAPGAGGTKGTVNTVVSLPTNLINILNFYPSEAVSMPASTTIAYYKINSVNGAGGGGEGASSPGYGGSGGGSGSNGGTIYIAANNFVSLGSVTAVGGNGGNGGNGGAANGSGGGGGAGGSGGYIFIIYQSSLTVGTTSVAGGSGGSGGIKNGSGADGNAGTTGLAGTATTIRVKF